MLRVLLKRGFHLSRSSPPESYAHLSGPASSKVGRTESSRNTYRAVFIEGLMFVLDMDPLYQPLTFCTTPEVWFCMKS